MAGSQAPDQQQQQKTRKKRQSVFLFTSMANDDQPGTT